MDNTLLRNLSRFVPRQVRPEVWAIDDWCQLCNEEVGKMKATVKLRRLQELANLTERAFSGGKTNYEAVDRFALMIRHKKIPYSYPSEFILALQTEAERIQFKSEIELQRYCFRRAGSVALMFAHTVGLSSESALRHVADLGSAIRLAQIAEEIVVYSKSAIFYAPEVWIKDEKMVLNSKGELERYDLVKLVRKFLDLSKQHLNSAQFCLSYFPYKTALALGAVLKVMGDRELVVLRAAETGLELSRISYWQRRFGLFRSRLSLMTSIPERLHNPFEPVTIKTVWKPFNF